MTRRPKILHIGLPKTGTTTLFKALTRAGYNVADWRVRKKQTKNEALHDQLVGEILYEGYFRTGDPLHYLEGFDAITEMSAVVPGHNFWPQTDWALLTAIRSHYPETKFLLSTRDPAKAADSMMRWNSLGKTRLPRNSVPGMPAGYGGSPDEVIRWIQGHYAFCRAMFTGDDAFFEFDIEDPLAPDKISAFLGRPLPWWGKANANVNTPANEAAKMKEEC